MVNVVGTSAGLVRLAGANVFVANAVLPPFQRFPALLAVVTFVLMNGVLVAVPVGVGQVLVAGSAEHPIAHEDVAPLELERSCLSPVQSWNERDGNETDE